MWRVWVVGVGKSPWLLLPRPAEHVFIWGRFYKWIRRGKTFIPYNLNERMSETSLNISLSTTPPFLNYVNFFFIVFNTVFLLLILILILILGRFVGWGNGRCRKIGKEIVIFDRLSYPISVHSAPVRSPSTKQLPHTRFPGWQKENYHVRAYDVCGGASVRLWRVCVQSEGYGGE